LAGLKLAAADTSSAVSSADVAISSMALQVEAGRAQASAAYTANVAQPAMQGSLNMLQPSWGEAIVQRVMWLSAQGLKSAEIALDPPELGALQVRISTQHDQAAVSFTSPNAQVRESLDQNMPRLREMLDQQGLSLADSSVADQGRSQHADEQERSNKRGIEAGEDTEEIVAANDRLGAISALTLGVGIIDHYA
jgi:flagellar hook-length control protein FliK